MSMLTIFGYALSLLLGYVVMSLRWLIIVYDNIVETQYCEMLFQQEIVSDSLHSKDLCK